MSAMFNSVLRSLRGANLEVLKFGMYLSFPIGWMYYFGTNLEERFNVPGFWPTKEQSHQLPYEREDIRNEVERIKNQMRQRQAARGPTSTEEPPPVVSVDNPREDANTRPKRLLDM